MSSDAQNDDSVYDQPWLQAGSQSHGSSSDWVSKWDSAFAFSSEKEIDAVDGEIGAAVEEDDLFSSIRDYFTQKEGERKEEAREGNGLGHVSENVVSVPAMVQTGVARLQIEYTGQLDEGKRVMSEDRQVSKSVRHSSVDSTEENEAEQCSIYECLELQCEWPSPSVKGSASLERNPEEKKGACTETGLEGKFDTWTELEKKQEDKEEEINESPSLIRQESVPVEPNSESTSQLSEAAQAKVSSSSTKRHNSRSVHVSFRPSTESIQFHNPLESKEAHWKARLRRLSHFHTHSHSAGERTSRSGSGGKLAAEGAGKFVSRTGISHKVGSQERFLSGTAAEGCGTVATDAGSLENKSGTRAEKDKQYSGSFTKSNPGSEINSEVLSSSSGSSSVSTGVRGRLGRSTLRSRVSRSRSQEPGSSISRHHQGALLGGVYKSVVYALSSKPRPRGQGSSQGSSPQRQSRAAMGDASLKDLYSHVLGYFGRKTTTPGEATNEVLIEDTPVERNAPQCINTSSSFPFWLFLTGLL